MKKVRDIIDEHAKRVERRAGFDTLHQEVIDLYFPNRADILTPANDQQGRERGKRICDSTPEVSVNRLSAVLQSTLSNRETQWLQLATDDEELNEAPEVKDWLARDLKVFRRALDSSNFYSQMGEFYPDLIASQATMFIEESNSPERDFYFSTRHIRECYISYSDQDIVDHMDLVRNMTARQVKSRWAKKKGKTGSVPERVLKAFKKDPETPFSVIQSVFPNEGEIKYGGINPLRLPYQCSWILEEEGEEIDRGGYNEFPFLSVPWTKMSGEDYGRGPCMLAMADVRQLYQMRKTFARVAEKAADPPLQVPRKGFQGQIKLTPGGLNYYDQTSKARIEPIATGANLPVTWDAIKDQRDQIRDHFYLNQLQLIDAREMTAEEVRARMMENARVLGPTVWVISDKGLDPLVGRCLGILRRAGKLTPIPDVVLQAARKKGTQLRVKFVSPLAKAQVASEVQGITHTAATALEWAKITGSPDILDNLDFDIGIQRIADLDGTPPDFLRDPKKVALIRKTRKEAQQAQASLAAAQQAAGVAKDAAAANAMTAETEGRA